MKWVLLGAMGLLFLAAFGTVLVGGNLASESNSAAQRVFAACEAAEVSMTPDAFIGLAATHGVQDVRDRRELAPEGSGFTIELIDGGFRDVTRCVGTFDESGVLVATESFRID